MDNVVHPFGPLWNRYSRILILGSFPSLKSREEGFYYAHPRNRFWPMMEALFSVHLATIGEKKDFLLEHGIGIWDSVASCDIKGSDDASIKNIVPNDIMPIISASRIERILCNGTRSWDTYMKYIYPQTGMEAVRLPSTSPANAAWSLERLVQVWGPRLTLS